jgi:hypothetical protein
LHQFFLRKRKHNLSKRKYYDSSSTGFYQKLLGWEKLLNTQQNNHFISVYSKAGQGPMLVFQDDPDYEPVVWPTGRGRQQTYI